MPKMGRYNSKEKATLTFEERDERASTKNSNYEQNEEVAVGGV